MILEALCRHYETLLQEEKAVKRGWSYAKISAALQLDREGNLTGVLPLETGEGGGKKKRMRVPERTTRTVKIMPMYLCDTSSYFLGVDDKGKPERSKKCFLASAELHQKQLESCNSPAAVAIRNFFAKWKPEEAEANEVFREHRDEIVTPGNLLFWVEDRFAQEDEEIVRAWEAACMKESDSPEGLCLVTGRRGPIARLHPMFREVRGAQSSGAALISFNTDKVSFSSYGKDGEQGLNAYVSEEAAFAYGAALSYLLNDDAHRKFIGDMTVVYWAENQNDACQDIFSGLGFDDGNEMTQEDLDGILQAVRDGRSIVYGGQEIPYDNDFYILGLSPNAARISVRFFYRSSFGEILSRVQRHHERMAIVQPGNKERFSVPLWRLLLATVSPKSKEKSASPLMAGTTLRAILTDSPYPPSLYQNVMRRIKAEQDDTDARPPRYKITAVRAAIIKAYLMKNKGRQITVALDENNENTAYVLGRIFSVWEQIQEAANPGLNSTIKDRYFNAACATPTAVFSKLQILSNHHLRKLEPGREVYFEKKLTELMGKLDGEAPLPKTLSLDEQGMFILGYYHQTQKRYEKKEEK